MKTALLAALLLLTGCASAPPKVQTPQATMDLHQFLMLIGGTPQSTSEWKKYDTLHEAAVAMAERLVECSVYYECAGQIFNHDGKFVRGPVHSDYASDHVSMDDDAPMGWELAADVHSHPCAPRSVTRVFSPEDMIGAIIQRVPASYMLDMCTGDVHEFIPNVTKIDQELVAGDVWLSQGKIIGHIQSAKMPLVKDGI